MKDNMTQLPILTNKVEVDLVPWVAGMQREGYPVCRDIILVNTNEIYCKMYNLTQSKGYL